MRPSILILLFLASAVLAASPGAGARREGTRPILHALSVGNGGTKYAGDRRLLTTITPNADGFRDRAIVSFRLRERARVRMTISQSKPVPKTVFTVAELRPRGLNRMVWAPGLQQEPRTYLVSLHATNGAGKSAFVVPQGPRYGRRTPVVRVQGVAASFGRESYAPRTTATLRVSTDARSLTLEIFQVGPMPYTKPKPGTMVGKPVTAPVRIAGRSRSAPFSLRVFVGPWPSGLYFARLTAADGRVGYAPFVVRPRRLGEHSIAVVLPTKTWQAYNWYDADGNGYGDTWYSGAEIPARLARPYLDHGVPPYYRFYDAAFLSWVARQPQPVDYLAQSDLTRAPNGAVLAGSYNLIAFPGHHEYVTKREYDLIVRYRNLGGNLMFLSANNFFRRIVHRGSSLVRLAQWRHLGRPEAALIGVQYRANDRGQRRGAYVVRDAASAPWFFEGTTLAAGTKFGSYGIEIDAKTRSSPPGTKVLAEIPDLFGAGVSAQMTYYETPAGAKVFAAGAFTIAGRAFLQPERQLLANLWARLSQP